MNKLTSILILILTSTSSIFGQQFTGNYKNRNDSLFFSNNKVTFCLSDFSALSSQIVGEGTYEYVDQYLIINTGEYSGTKSKYGKNKAATENTPNIKVSTSDGYSFQGVLIEFLSNSNKVISQAITDNEGNATQPINDKIAKIRASSMGYNGIEFECNKDVDYSIVMAKNNVIQNQIVVLELIEEDEGAISVRLLSDNLKAGKNINKELEKAYRKTEKLNILRKRLTKEYISEFYNR